MADDDETASINHQVSQINQSAGPKFREVISDNMQIIILKFFFPGILLLLLTLIVFY